MSDLHMTPDRAETYRIAAAELLVEANTRGDQDDPTIAFAVGFLLSRANTATVAMTISNPPTEAEIARAAVDQLGTGNRKVYP